MDNEPCKPHGLRPCPWCAADAYRQWNREQAYLDETPRRLLRTFVALVAVEVAAVAGILYWAFCWHSY